MLNIATDWEKLVEGSAEERACFGALKIEFDGLSLTEGHDPFVNRVRRAPLLSAYHFAEWLAWNWWRLRWEPRSASLSWPFAHRFTTIGEGYVWPNILVFSDGERIAVIAKPSSSQDDRNYRYISDAAVVVPAVEFESAVDRFVTQVIGQANAEGVGESNLETLWRELLKERRTRETSRYRKYEALLGFDPDEAPAEVVERLLHDEDELGSSASAELAAENAFRVDKLFAEDLRTVAESSGVRVSNGSVFELPNVERVNRGQTPAWLVGQRIARAVRTHLGFSTEPISNARLAGLMGLKTKNLVEPAGQAPLAFALTAGASNRRIVFRSKWEAGRRFELARLIGDNIISAGENKLWPLTRSYTYRQKAQRSFAAEFLAPFDAVDDFLSGEYSDDHQQEAAEHFSVSPLTIRTLLVNHGRLDRDELMDAEVESAHVAAAQ